jgi:hypothetical protein
MKSLYTNCGIKIKGLYMRQVIEKFFCKRWYESAYICNNKRKLIRYNNFIIRGVGAMKAITAFEWGHVRAGLAHERNRAQVWKDISKTMRGAAEKIIEAAVVVLIAGIFIAAVMRVHESCEATAYFNDAIANTVVTLANGN